MKKLFLILAVLTLYSCDREFENESDFRNYLRDKHPYSELIKADLSEYRFKWCYQVNDTVNNETWIYISSSKLINMKSHLVTK